MLKTPSTTARPRVRFNPGYYKRARRRHENGDSTYLVEMMREAAIDSHAHGCLIGRRAGFKKSYSLSPYDDDDPDQERIDFFRGVLQRIRLRDLLEAIHDARLFLFSVIDFEWAARDGYQVPTRFEHFDNKHFRRDREGTLKIDFASELREIPDTALTVEAGKTPLMLPVLRDYILKEFGLESWASFLETFGEPFIMAKHPPGVDDDFKKQVDTALDDLAASARGRAPQGTDLEVHEASRTTGDHMDFTERSDTGISITLLGHANAVEDSGGVNVGGRQHSFEVRHHIAVDDIHFIEPHVNRFIRLVGEANFGDGRYPRFELNKAKPVDAKQHAEILDMAYRQRVPIHISEWEKLGIRVDTSGDEWIQKPQSGTNPFLD